MPRAKEAVGRVPALGAPIAFEIGPTGIDPSPDQAGEPFSTQSIEDKTAHDATDSVHHLGVHCLQSPRDAQGGKHRLEDDESGIGSESAVLGEDESRNHVKSTVNLCSALLDFTFRALLMDTSAVTHECLYRSGGPIVFVSFSEEHVFTQLGGYVKNPTFCDTARIGLIQSLKGPDTMLPCPQISPTRRRMRRNDSSPRRDGVLC